MIPRRVITTYTRGKILQNLKPLRVCARARARVGACVYAREIVNKLSTNYEQNMNNSIN